MLPPGVGACVLRVKRGEMEESGGGGNDRVRGGDVKRGEMEEREREREVQK